MGTLNVDDPYETHIGFVLGRLALSALGANICYTFAYALEFLFGSDEPTSRWLRFGRTTFLIAGVLLGMLLALIGGSAIARLEWQQFYGR